MKEPPTKLQLYDTLAHATKARNGELIQLSGDCYVARVEGEVRLAIALKESDQKKKVWVGAPNPMTRLLMGRYTFVDTDEVVSTRADRIFIALIHRPTKTVMLLPLADVWRTIAAKAQANRTPIEWSFDVELVGYHKYVVKRGTQVPDIPVPYVGSLDHAITLLDQPLAK